VRLGLLLVREAHRQQAILFSLLHLVEVASFMSVGSASGLSGCADPSREFWRLLGVQRCFNHLAGYECLDFVMNLANHIVLKRFCCCTRLPWMYAVENGKLLCPEG